MTRRDEIHANLDEVRARIAESASAAGRDPSEVTLIAVTKTYPASDVGHLAALGVTDVGENRDQEAAPKAAECRASGVEVRWHHVGQLQRNKARSVASYAAAVHSVDRPELVAALDAARSRLDLPALDVFVQVSLDGDTRRGGVLPARLAEVADAVADAGSLRLAGVMAVAPIEAAPDAAFARLADIAADLRRNHPEATSVSAGMSGDLREAIAHGATHVRVGSAILGPRVNLR